MGDSVSGLANSVRLPVVVKLLGQLLLVLVFLTLPPLLFSLVLGDWEFGIRLAAVIAVCLACFGFSARVPVPRRIQNNEALVVISLTFLVTASLMTFPLIGAGVQPLDAFFESVSAVTTTGLSTVTGLSQRSASFLFTRAWMQWYGGLGIVVFSVALMAHHHSAARRLTDPDSSDNLMSSASVHARQVLLAYGLVSVIGLLLLWLLIGDGFSALLHVLASVSTGGFSPFENSLEGLAGRSGKFGVIGLSFLGAVPLPLFYSLWRKGGVEIFRDLELNAYLIAVATTCGMLFLLLASGKDDSAHVLENAVLMGISAQSTTGFSSMDLLSLPPAALLVLVFAMFIGGCVGSTAGGAKVLRVLIGFRLLFHSLLLSALPSRAVSSPKLGGRTLHDDESIRALLLLLSFAGVIGLSWLVFVAFGYPALNALFEVCSATATSGLSTGITRSSLEPGLKLLLCADMLLGRLEIVALLVLCYPRTWFAQRESG